MFLTSLWLVFSIYNVLVESLAEPELEIAAYHPQGFKVRLRPGENVVREFSFHANINSKIKPTDIGSYSFLSTKAGRNGWLYFDPELKLDQGDIVYYWAYIQYEDLDKKLLPYGIDDKWPVENLLPLSQLDICFESKTWLSNNDTVCKDAVIFEDKFGTNKLDTTKWNIEHIIPAGPDYEFNYYSSQNETCFIKDKTLYLKPLPETDEHKISTGRLDLGDRCTGNGKECTFNAMYWNYSPPVVSAKIKSKISFKYGKVKIRCRLPRGDWLYPIIHLESIYNPSKKILIAFARGNDDLRDDNGSDIGGKLLFAGPVLDPNEPKRSSHLTSSRFLFPPSNRVKTYTVTWDPKRITFEQDDNVFGTIDERIAGMMNDPVRLTLGVGVGGINNFPDNYKSGGKIKPWINSARIQVKHFFQARNDWLSTWNGDSTALRVENVKISTV